MERWSRPILAPSRARELSEEARDGWRVAQCVCTGGWHLRRMSPVCCFAALDASAYQLAVAPPCVQERERILQARQQRQAKAAAQAAQARMAEVVSLPHFATRMSTYRAVTACSVRQFLLHSAGVKPAPLSNTAVVSTTLRRPLTHTPAPQLQLAGAPHLLYFCRCSWACRMRRTMRQGGRGSHDLARPGSASTPPSPRSAGRAVLVGGAAPLCVESVLAARAHVLNHLLPSLTNLVTAQPIQPLPARRQLRSTTSRPPPASLRCRRPRRAARRATSTS